MSIAGGGRREAPAPGVCRGPPSLPPSCAAAVGARRCGGAGAASGSISAMSHSAERRLALATLAETVRGRASVRRYLPDPVPRADVTAIVELAVRAANAGNAQMWRFVAVDDPGTRAALRRAVDDALDVMAAWPELAGRDKEIKALRAYATFFADAPLVLAVFALPYASRADEMLEARGASREEHDRLRARPDLQSVGAAVQLFCTAAQALGYGACWMTAPVLAAPAIEKLLGAEPAARLAAIVPVGRPAGAVDPTSRLPLGDVLEFR